MINQKALQAVNQATFLEEFCRPLYGSYCFSRIPETVKGLFSGDFSKGLPLDVFGGKPEACDAVILLFIDGFGWRFLEKYGERYPFLKRFLEQGGIASKITSQFPSTTAAHVTCMNTGLPVGQSGVYEWFYYEPLVDAMIAPLLFSFAGDKALGTLKNKVSPQQLYPTHTLYQDLKTMGVTSYVMQESHIAHSPYSQVMFHGAQMCPYETLAGGLSQIVELLPTSPAYFYLYFGEIDSMGHRHGIDSEEFEAAVHQCFTALEESLFAQIPKTQKKVACVVIADHGMTAVDPQTTFYVNEEIPEIRGYFKKNRKGDLLVPAGSCRDFFLHIQDERLDAAAELLRRRLRGRAEVILTQELIEEGFFGEKIPSERFLQRVGNLVILPYKNEGVWWHEKPRFSQHFYASHGGLTREEMETIFLFSYL